MKLSDITTLFDARRQKYVDFCERTDQLVSDGILKNSCDRDDTDVAWRNTATYRKNRYYHHAFDKFPEKLQFIKDVAHYLGQEYGHAEIGDEWEKETIFIMPEGVPSGNTFLQVNFGWKSYNPARMADIRLFSRRNHTDGCALGYMSRYLSGIDGDAQQVAKQIIISSKLWMSMTWGSLMYPNGMYGENSYPYRQEHLFNQMGEIQAAELKTYSVHKKINLRSDEPYRHTVTEWEAFDMENLDKEEYYAFKRLKKKYKTSLKYKRGEDILRICRQYDHGRRYFKGTYNNFNFQRDIDLEDIPMDGTVDEIFDAIMAIAI